MGGEGGGFCASSGKVRKIARTAGGGGCDLQGRWDAIGVRCCLQHLGKIVCSLLKGYRRTLRMTATGFTSTKRAVTWKGSFREYKVHMSPDACRAAGLLSINTS